jgi:rhamnogalacturonyl hydrolase YesR
MLSDDEDRYKGIEFAIPDSTYWATRVCAIASEIARTPGESGLYLQQAIFQLEQGIKFFFDPQKGLVRTGLFNGEPGKTYWCRSQGWLLWAIAGLLRHLPKDHAKFASFARTMEQIADGVMRMQAARGSLHVLVDDPSTPEEVTGIAMVIGTIKEAMRKDWISGRHEELCRRGWAFVLESVDMNGIVRNAYTGWALTAEERQVDLMDRYFRGFVPGIVLVAADAMLA